MAAALLAVLDEHQLVTFPGLPNSCGPDCCSCCPITMCQSCGGGDEGEACITVQAVARALNLVEQAQATEPEQPRRWNAGEAGAALDGALAMVVQSARGGLLTETPQDTFRRTLADLGWTIRLEQVPAGQDGRSTGSPLAREEPRPVSVGDRVRAEFVTIVTSRAPNPNVVWIDAPGGPAFANFAMPVPVSVVTVIDQAPTGQNRE
ncbi:hypothetical protein [Actinokineospora sp.]|uniref:hypothetical protein n=1 Tax=Actinokineospora sp. TaxID=1872133 RepID=UPI003D6AA3B4